MRALTITTIAACITLWATAALADQPHHSSTPRQRHPAHATSTAQAAAPSPQQPASTTQLAQQTASPSQQQPASATQPSQTGPIWSQAQDAASQQPSQGTQTSPSPQRTPPSSPQPQAPTPTAPGTQTTAGPASYSANTLYNLANSYARAGKPGLAVLNYERAALLAPNDPDIVANLEFVRATANVPTPPRTRLQQFAESTSPTTAAWLGVVGIVMLGASLVASRATRKLRGLRIVSGLLGIGLIALAASSAALMWPHMHDAVVLLNQTPARVSPVPMGDTAFVLREADTVTMTAEHEDFILVRTRSGRTGWVARSSLGLVAQ